jgi:hypothetical protein
MGLEKSAFWITAPSPFPEILPHGMEISWQVLIYPPSYMCV